MSTSKTQAVIALHYAKRTQQLSLWKYKRRIGPNYNRQLVHPRLQTPQENSVAGPNTLTMLGLVCETDAREVHGKLSKPLFANTVRWQKYPWEVDKCAEISFMNKLKPNNYYQHPVHHTDWGRDVIFDVTVWLQIAHYTHSYLVDLTNTSTMFIFLTYECLNKPLASQSNPNWDTKFTKGIQRNDISTLGSKTLGIYIANTVAIGVLVHCVASTAAATVLSE